MPRASAIPHLVASLRLKQVRSVTNSAITSLATLPKTRSTPAHSRCAATSARSKPPTNSLPHSPPQPRHHDQVSAPLPLRSGKGYLWAVSIMGVVLGIYLVTLGLAESRGRKKNAELDIEQNADVSDRWRDKTRNFDHEVDNAESAMLMRAKRSRLVGEAYGKVLEVSVGTGRNMDLYDLRPYEEAEDKKYGRSRERIISSLTFNDQSEVMVDQAANKFLAMELQRKESERFKGDVTFIVGDAGKKGVIDRPAHGYDTIVQTFGICSMANPVEFLQTLGKLCRQPGEGQGTSTQSAEGIDDGGQILLLEHGRGHYDWLNNLLDGKAKVHALRYGCWWNKDIAQVIQESGLKVERIKRYHGGTTWEIVLRPVAASTIN